MANTVTKKEVVTLAAMVSRNSRTETEVIVSSVFDQIITALERGQDVRLGSKSLRKLVEETEA